MMMQQKPCILVTKLLGKTGISRMEPWSNNVIHKQSINFPGSKDYTPPNNKLGGCGMLIVRCFLSVLVIHIPFFRKISDEKLEQ